MIWLRIAGLSLLALSCSIGGIFHGARYQRRISAIEQARTFLLTLRHTLRFTLAPPTQLLSMLKSDPVLAGCDYLDGMTGYVAPTDFSSEWTRAVEESSAPLDAPERRLLSSVGDILGASDLDTQLGQLGLLIEQLDAILSEARVSCEKNRRLSATLGSLLGLSLAVILF